MALADLHCAGRYHMLRVARNVRTAPIAGTSSIKFAPIARRGCQCCHYVSRGRQARRHVHRCLSRSQDRSRLSVLREDPCISSALRFKPYLPGLPRPCRNTVGCQSHAAVGASRVVHQRHECRTPAASQPVLFHTLRVLSTARDSKAARLCSRSLHQPTDCPASAGYWLLHLPQRIASPTAVRGGGTPLFCYIPSYTGAHRGCPRWC
jgi:hypothetical protein